MRNFCYHLEYYWNKFAKVLQSAIFKILNALSFLALAFYFVYIIYFSMVSFDLSKLVAGCISLCVMIHLNKSLG